MSRVITFSRHFPKSHPRSGEPTYFVEKIWCSDFVEINGVKFYVDYTEFLRNVNSNVPFEVLYEFAKSISNKQFDPKYHTIRSGHRFKVGDKFSPRVWSGKHYASKQIIIAPDIEVKKVWNIYIDENGVIDINGKYLHESDDCFFDFDACNKLAKNDGLDFADFASWFPLGKIFSGQIICWNENINY